MAKSQKPRTRNDKQRDRPRAPGTSKMTGRSGSAEGQVAGKRRGKEESYEGWNKQALYERAKKMGIEGRSKMSKHELLEAIREH